MTPGAVPVSGMNSMVTTGFQEDDLTMTEEDSTSHLSETNDANSTRMILEAKLVVEEDSELLAQQEREQIEKAARQIRQELGQVPQAEIVEDDGSKNRRWTLLCAGVMVVILATIIAIALATRDDSPNAGPSQTPTVAPLNNNLCKEAHPIVPGDAPIVANLENAEEQCFVLCESPDHSNDSPPGLWYKVRGVRDV